MPTTSQSVIDVESTALVPTRTKLARVDRTVTAIVVKGKAPSRAERAYLYQRGDTWWFRKTILGRQVNVTTACKDFDDARRRADEIDAAVKADVTGWDPKAEKANRVLASTTVREWFTRYFAKFSIQRAVPRSDKRAIAFMEAHATLMMRSIKSSHATDWIVYRTTEAVIPKGCRNAGKPYSSDTIAVEVMTLKAIFQRAVEEGVIKSNVWTGKVVEGGRIARESVLSLGDQPKLFAELVKRSGGRRGENALEALRACEALLGTGARYAEFRRIRPCDIINGQLDIWRGKRGKLRGSRKERKARYVPLQPATLAVLESQRIHRGLEPGSTQPLWPYTECWLGKYLTRACKAAGVVVYLEPEQPGDPLEVRGPITPHDLRRTYGTRLATPHPVTGKMVPPKVLMLLMGHTSIEITMRHYQGFDQADKTSMVLGSDLGLTTPKVQKVVQRRSKVA